MNRDGRAITLCIGQNTDPLRLKRLLVPIFRFRLAGGQSAQPDHKQQTERPPSVSMAPIPDGAGQTPPVLLPTAVLHRTPLDLSLSLSKYPSVESTPPPDNSQLNAPRPQHRARGSGL